MTATDWTIFWNELSARLSDVPSGRMRDLVERVVESLRMRPILRYGISAVSLILIGVLIGRIALTTPQELEIKGLSEKLSETEKTLLSERAQNYLQRSKILLLGIINTTADAPNSWSKEREVSRSLITEASGLQRALSDADQQRMRKLVGDLQLILLQIANLEQGQDYPGMEIVRDGVERNGLLLKINLEQMRAEVRGSLPPRDPQRHSGKQERKEL